MNNLLSNLLSGLFAAVFTLVAGWLLERRKAKRKLKSLSLILYFEVNNHLYWLQHFNTLSSKMFSSSTNEEWDKAKLFLADELSYEDFSALMEHFRTVAAVRKLISTRQTLMLEEFLPKYVEIAQTAHALLFKQAGISEDNVLSYNLKRKSQQL